MNTPNSKTESIQLPLGASKRRLRTLTWGAVPIVVMAAALSIGRIPGTDLTLAVPYAAEGPGPTVDTLGDIDGTAVVDVQAPNLDNPTGHLNMTTVSVRTNMTLPEVLQRWIASDDTIVPIDTVIPQGQSQEEVQETNQQAFTQSESSATVAAMSYLGLPVHIAIADVVESSPAQSVLEKGDILTKINGQAVSKPQEAQEIIRALKPGDDVEISFRRPHPDAADAAANSASTNSAGTEQTVHVTLAESPHAKGVPMLGVLMSSEPDSDIKVTYNLQDIGGPSAGMMFTLAVIDKLSDGDLTGGKFVAGTGTIREDGTVGPIGGIVHKARAAKDAGAQLFLAPAENCAEAVSKPTGDMVVASVSNLDDAVTAMKDFAEGKPVKTCQS